MKSLQRLRLLLALAATLGAFPAASSRADNPTPASPPPATPPPAAAPAVSLRQASTQEWLQAPLPQQLSTASEWVLASKQLKLKPSDVGAVERQADKLRQCINGALRGHGKLYAGMRVSDLATTCLLTMKP